MTPQSKQNHKQNRINFSINVSSLVFHRESTIEAKSQRNIISSHKNELIKLRTNQIETDFSNKLFLDDCSQRSQTNFSRHMQFRSRQHEIGCSPAETSHFFVCFVQCHSFDCEGACIHSPVLSSSPTAVLWHASKRSTLLETSQQFHHAMSSILRVFLMDSFSSPEFESHAVC